MIGIVLLVIAVPIAAAALAWFNWGPAAGIVLGLVALAVTAGVTLGPFSLLVRAHKREAQAEPPLEWIDGEKAP